MLFGPSNLLISSAVLFRTACSLPTVGRESVQLPLQPPSAEFILDGDRETLQEAAVHARELIQYRSQGIGTLMSTYSKDTPDPSLQGLPIGLQEYFAPYPNGDLLLLALPISGIFHNIQTNPSHSATIAIKDELGLIQRNGSLWAANWRRISLFGTVQPVTDNVEAKALYESVHPDGSLWDGEDGPHRHSWVRFQVDKVYYFGGFGDRGAIGWLDMDLYRTSFKDSEESKSRSVCFHPSGENLYCEQLNSEEDEMTEILSEGYVEDLEAEETEEEVEGSDEEEELSFDDEEWDEITEEEEDEQDEADEGETVEGQEDSDDNEQETEAEHQPEEDGEEEEEEEPAQVSIIQIINNHPHHYHQHFSSDRHENEDDKISSVANELIDQALVEEIGDQLTDRMFEGSEAKGSDVVELDYE